MDKKVSILIPAYNRQDFIKTALKSCTSQTYNNFEVIVYDDGSTDETLNEIKDFIKNCSIKNKNKIRIIEGVTNKGIGVARNILLNSFDSEYACWLDSDDMMTSNRLQDCINYMDVNPETDIIYSNIQWFTGNNPYKYGTIISPNITRYSKDKFESISNNSSCASGFFKSDFKKYKFLEGLNLGGEDSLWLWDIIKDDRVIRHIDRVLYYYRSHGNRIGIIKRKEEFKELKDKEGLIVYNYLNNIKKNESDK